MLNENSIKRVKEFLYMYGGLHAQPLKSDGKLRFEDSISYYTEMMVYAQKLQTPSSTADILYNATKVLILALELDIIQSMFIKNYEQSWSKQHLTKAEYNGLPSWVISHISGAMYHNDFTAEAAVFRVIDSAISFLVNVNQRLNTIVPPRELIKHCIKNVCVQNKTKLFGSFDSAQQSMAVHYLAYAEVVPSLANVDAYLQYVDKKQEDGTTIRYFGEIGKLTTDVYPTIVMRPKSGAIVADTKYYQIRPAKDKENVYALCEIDRVRSTVSIIDSPLTKEIYF